MRNEVEEPHVRYKPFMLFFTAHVLEHALEASLPSDTLFMVQKCQHVHDRHILDQMLARPPRLDPGSKASVALNMAKHSRYFSVSRFLLKLQDQGSPFSVIIDNEWLPERLSTNSYFTITFHICSINFHSLSVYPYKSNASGSIIAEDALQLVMGS